MANRQWTKNEVLPQGTGGWLIATQGMRVWTRGLQGTRPGIGKREP
jgi:hypothetical protein